MISLRLVLLAVAVSALFHVPAYSLDASLEAEFPMALEAPAINTQPGPEYADDKRHFALATGMEVTPKGRLWVGWFSGGDSEKGFLLVVSSDDRGNTWTKPLLVIDPTDGPTLARRTLVANFWTDPKGQLWLFFDQSMGYFDGRAGLWAIVCANPDAEKPVWSAPRRLWHGCMLNKPTVLSTGEWLLPVSIWDKQKFWGGVNEKVIWSHQPLYPELDEFRMANVLISRDEGKTWERQGGVRFPEPDFDEHMIVEKKDGALWMLARTKKGLWQSFSKDKGKTWSAPEPSAIAQTNSRFFLRRLHSGNLLLVKNGKGVAVNEGRRDLSAYISKDDGQTWVGGLMLDGRGGVSYPDGTQHKDGTIYVNYDYWRDGAAEILVTRFREEDVLASAFQSEESRSRLLVNKATGPKPPKPEKKVKDGTTYESAKDVDTKKE